VQFFVDESWQTIAGREIGALGGVGIPERRYNAFCREVFALKRDVLGAQKLSDCELRGMSCFAKSAFRWRDAHGYFRLLDAAERMLETIERHQGRTFLIWTSDPTLSVLRNPDTAGLSKPYRQLLQDMRALMRNEAPRRRGALTLRRRRHRDDEAAACAISNFLFRARGDWAQRFTQVPTFTASSISPGLQAADIVVHLGPHLADASQRPELGPYIASVQNLRYEYRQGAQQRLHRTIRRVG
jgi:hypothetical protein